MTVNIQSLFTTDEGNDWLYTTLDGKPTYSSTYRKDSSQLTTKEAEYLAQKVTELEEKLAQIRRISL